MTLERIPVVPCYWPARSGIFLWEEYRRHETRRDLELAAGSGFADLGLKLVWSDFQPSRHGVSAEPMRVLERLLQDAADTGITFHVTVLLATFGCVLSLPAWAVEPGTDSGAHLLAGHHLSRWQPRDLYQDSAMRAAQARLVREVTTEFRGHPAVGAWILADGITEALRPSSSDAFSEWLRLLRDSCGRAADTTSIGVGMSVRDLVLSPAVDPSTFRETGMRAHLGAGWRPPWAADSEIRWLEIVAAYAATLTGTPPGISLPRARPQSIGYPASDAAVEQTMSALAAIRVAWCALPTMFTLSDEAARVFPGREDQERYTHGLLTAGGDLTPAGRVWSELPSVFPGSGGQSRQMPEVDPELRLSAPEAAARAFYETYAR